MGASCSRWVCARPALPYAPPPPVPAFQKRNVHQVCRHQVHEKVPANSDTASELDALQIMRSYEPSASSSTTSSSSLQGLGLGKKPQGPQQPMRPKLDTRLAETLLQVPALAARTAAADGLLPGWDEDGYELAFERIKVG